MGDPKQMQQIIVAYKKATYKNFIFYFLYFSMVFTIKKIQNKVDAMHSALHVILRMNIGIKKMT